MPNDSFLGAGENARKKPSTAPPEEEKHLNLSFFLSNKSKQMEVAYKINVLRWKMNVTFVVA